MGDKTYRGTLNILWPKLEAAFAELDDVQLEQAIDALEAEGAFVPTEPTPEDHRALDPEVLGDRWYAIHDSELKLLATLGGFIEKAVSKGLDSFVPGVPGLVSFWWSYRRRRVELTALQGTVLLVLKQAGNAGMAVTELIQGRDLDEAEVVTALHALLKIRRGDGTTTALVEQDGDRWIRLDV